MPLLALLLIAVLVGALVARLSLEISRRHTGREATEEVGAAIAERPGLRAATQRAEPQRVTGFALVVGLAIVLGGGVLLAVLAFLVRSDSGLVRLDRSVADWGQRHASPFSDHVLNAITFVGQPVSMGVLAALVALAATLRTRNRWVAPFMLVVMVGTGVLTTTVKEFADRARPALNPVAETLGPSFPSGHSSWSAAFLAATALILSRNRTPRTRALVAGVAAGLAVTVAATRVLLAMHWLSDVIAGLALGWAWFTVCAIAFGGRVLRFGAGVEQVRHETREAPSHASAPG
ncbi:phosphatase PAP2 family protein [Solirubrobacter soli]|uniref:phosphatase PAP2 family protein n=1 Tax=Solirubrobacter soli TaxID=363832 RepID=UPI000422A08A|nr:phosphatase PAP2 family protein [Solirubrobacter soli]